MKYFKIVTLLSSILILSVSCNQRNQFNSLGEEDQDVALASSEPAHQSEIEELVSQKEIVKIGSKKKRKTASLRNTVGTNQLRVKKKHSDNKGSTQKEIVKIKFGVMEEPEENPKVENLSLLFYIDKKGNSCVYNFKKYAKEFLSNLNEVPFWEIGFAFHRDDQEWMDLERSRAKTLVKGAKYEESVFRHTLEVQREPEYGSYFDLDKRNAAPRHTDPLKGLSLLLDDLGSKENEKKVVLYFDQDFPYYTTEEWKTLYNKHPDLTILFMSKRSGNVSNLNAGLSANLDVAPVFGCDLRSPKVVENTLSQVLSRTK